MEQHKSLNKGRVFVKRTAAAFERQEVDKTPGSTKHISNEEAQKLLGDTFPEYTKYIFGQRPGMSCDNMTVSHGLQAPNLFVLHQHCGRA